MSSESITVDVQTGGETDSVELPADLVDLFREEPDETDAEIVADVLVMSFAERVHAVVHHGEGHGTESLEGIESAMMDRFEERFGMTFGQATGHDH